MSDDWDWDWDNLDSEGFSDLYGDAEPPDDLYESDFYATYDEQYEDTYYEPDLFFRDHAIERSRKGFPPNGALWQIRQSIKRKRKKNKLIVFDFFGNFSFRGKKYKLGAILTTKEDLAVNQKLPILRIYNPSKKNKEEVGVLWLSNKRTKSKKVPNLSGTILIDGEKHRLLAWSTPKDQRKANRRKPVLRLKV